MVAKYLNSTLPSNHGFHGGSGRGGACMEVADRAPGSLHALGTRPAAAPLVLRLLTLPIRPIPRGNLLLAVYCRDSVMLTTAEKGTAASARTWVG